MTRNLRSSTQRSAVQRIVPAGARWDSSTSQGASAPTYRYTLPASGIASANPFRKRARSFFPPAVPKPASTSANTSPVFAKLDPEAVVASELERMERAAGS